MTWEVRVVVVDPYGTAPTLPDLLADGWEPFAVHANHLWLRRQS